MNTAPTDRITDRSVMTSRCGVPSAEHAKIVGGDYSCKTTSGPNAIRNSGDRLPESACYAGCRFPTGYGFAASSHCKSKTTITSSLHPILMVLRNTVKKTTYVDSAELTYVARDRSTLVVMVTIIGLQLAVVTIIAVNAGRLVNSSRRVRIARV
jgi:hypothetical protein